MNPGNSNTVVSEMSCWAPVTVAGFKMPPREKLKSPSLLLLRARNESSVNQRFEEAMNVSVVLALLPWSLLIPIVIAAFYFPELGAWVQNNVWLPCLTALPLLVVLFASSLRRLGWRASIICCVGLCYFNAFFQNPLVVELFALTLSAYGCMLTFYLACFRSFYYSAALHPHVIRRQLEFLQVVFTFFVLCLTKLAIEETAMLTVVPVGAACLLCITISYHMYSILKTRSDVDERLP